MSGETGSVRSRRGLGLLALAALLLALPACGGGGGGGGTPTAMQPPGVSFTASGAPGSNTVYLQQNSQTNATTLVLDVVASDVTNLFAVSFDLHYPTQLLAYSKVTEGPFLSHAGQVKTSLLLSERQKGDLVIGLSRLGNVTGRNGSGVLMTLRFAASGAGTDSLSFTNETAYDGTIRQTGQPIQGFDWLAGSVTVRP